MRYILFLILSLIGLNFAAFADESAGSRQNESNSKEQTASSESEKQKTSNETANQWHFTDPEAQKNAQRVILGGND